MLFGLVWYCERIVLHRYTDRYTDRGYDTMLLLRIFHFVGIFAKCVKHVVSRVSIGSRIHVIVGLSSW